MTRHFKHIKTLFALAFMLGSGVLFSQNSQFNFLDYSLLSQKDSSLKSNYIIDGNVLASSGNISGKMLHKLLFGGFIDEDLKKQTYEHLQSMGNRAGLQANSNLTFVHDASNIFGNNSILFEKLSYDNYSEIKFNEDLFKLVFSGNQDFLNKNIDLKNQSIVNFSTLGAHVGFAKRHDFQDFSHTWATSFSFLAANDGIFGNIENGNIHTDSNYYQTHIDANYNLMRADTSNGFIKGNGAALSLYYQLNYKDIWKFGLSAENLGKIWWDNNSLSSNNEINLDFSGIEINDFNFLNSDENLSEDLDSLKNSLIYPSETKRFSTNLPARVGLFIDYKFSNNLNFTFRSLYYPNSLQTFESSLSVHWAAIKDRLWVSPFFYYSGYDLLRPSLELSYRHNKHFYIKLGTYTFHKKSSTMGAYTAIAISF
ncbi:MAG: hypothetical protein ACOXZK_08930 [Bacteroidales bacterium]|jgi:hypothetical protein|nr:hypothetical protein [Bacteroidales bacterium]